MQFKVGDRVRIMRGSDSGHNYTIKSKYPTFFGTAYTMHEYTYHSSYYGSQLRLIEGVQTNATSTTHK